MTAGTYLGQDRGASLELLDNVLVEQREEDALDEGSVAPTLAFLQRLGLGHAGLGVGLVDLGHDLSQFVSSVYVKPSLVPILYM